MLIERSARRRALYLSAQRREAPTPRRHLGQPLKGCPQGHTPNRTVPKPDYHGPAKGQTARTQKMWKVQRLELRPQPDAIAARHGRVGRVWANVARPKMRRATAERQAQLARADWQNRDTLIRVKR